jgi:chemotaxis protein histidine kinase CheA
MISDLIPAANEAADPVRARLHDLHARLVEQVANQGVDFAAIRSSLEGLQGEAEAYGRPGLAAALRRLSLLSEVGECLAAEGHGDARAIGGFFAEAFEALARDAQGDGNDELTSIWVIDESSGRWNHYVGLLEPSESELADDALLASSPEVPEDEGPSIDPATLLRMLGGNQGSGGDRSGLTQHSAEPDVARGFFSSAENRPLAHARARDERRTGLSDVVAVPWAEEFEVPPPPRPQARPTQPRLELALDSELREAFLADASDLFERIETLVLNLKEEGPHAETLHELSRCYHTLKGAAGSVGLLELASSVHLLEDRLEAAGGFASVELIDRLYESIRELEEVVFALRQGGPAGSLAEPAPAQPGLAAEAIRDEAWGDHLEEFETAEGAPRPVSPASRTADDEGPIRVSSHRIDALQDWASELMIRRNFWAAQAEDMKRFAATARTCRNRLMVSIDRLRDLRPALRAAAPNSSSADAQVLFDGLIRRLEEQAGDLAVLVDSAKASTAPLADESDALARLSLQVWEGLQAIRIVPVSGLFRRLVRVAREAARIEGRLVEVVMIGEETGADRSIQDGAYEPLLHVVRNAVGHGIEPAQERIGAGKPAKGRVTLEARREGNSLVLSVHDDGRGLDYPAIAAKGRRLGLLSTTEASTIERLNALVFQPGFSTRRQANTVSGRGVGMDIVAQEVRRLRGTIDLVSQPGLGTRLTIRLPARLALGQEMVVRVAGQSFAMPLESIELVQPFAEEDQESGGAEATVAVRGERVPLVDARRAVGVSATEPLPCPKLLLVRADGAPLAVLVEEIDGPAELVIKPLGPLLVGHPVISGTSLSVTGEVILTINPSGLARRPLEGTTLIPHPRASGPTGGVGPGGRRLDQRPPRGRAALAWAWSGSGRGLRRPGSPQPTARPCLPLDSDRPGNASHGWLRAAR